MMTFHPILQMIVDDDVSDYIPDDIPVDNNDFIIDNDGDDSDKDNNGNNN